MMLRKTTCAVGGVVLACAAAYSLSLAAQPRADNFDLRFLYENTTEKSDRLPVTRLSEDGETVAFDLPAASTTIVTKEAIQPRVESAVRLPRTTVRTVPINPVRDVPNEEVRKEKLPEGCEPAFSPVTNPAYAHISARCDS
jgi:hypothetical protein